MKRHEERYRALTDAIRFRLQQVRDSTLAPKAIAGWVVSEWRVIRSRLRRLRLSRAAEIRIAATALPPGTGLKDRAQMSIRIALRASRGRLVARRTHPAAISSGPLIPKPDTG